MRKLLAGTGLAAAVLLAQVCVTGGAGASARAATAATTTTMTAAPSASSTSSSFVTGAGSASAEAIDLNPALSGESIGIENDLSIANYDGTEGAGQSQLVSSTLLGILPSVPIPGTGTLESDSSGTTTSRTDSIAGSSGTTVGTETVQVGTSLGSVVTNLANISVPDVLTIAGAESTALTQVINNATRQSIATVDIASISLLGGVVQLKGLHWESEQETGAQTLTSNTFSVASLSLSGVSVPLSLTGLEPVLDTVNKALATTGFHISLPTSVVSNGVVQETPLTIGIDNSELGKELIAPEINPIQPIRTAVIDALLKAYPTLGTSDLVLEVVLGVLAGVGTLDLNLGGTYATTNDTAYANPLAGSSTAPDITSVLPTALGGLGGSSDDLGSGLLGGSTLPSSSSPATASTPGSTGTAKPLKLKELASSVTCQSTGSGGCHSQESWVALGSLLALTVLLLGTELLRMRRRRRLTVPEDA
jgi:hypothetical protein